MSDEQGFIRYKTGAEPHRTDWNQYGLDEIWAMVAREDGTVTAAQVQAWQRMAELCADQARALQQALGQLMARWPPRPGSAAEVLHARMAHLIHSMMTSANAAASLPGPLWRISNQLTIARYEVYALLEERQAYEQAAQVEDPSHGYGGRGAPPRLSPTQASSAPGWRAELDARARRAMAAAEAGVVRASSGMAALDVFDSRASQGGAAPAALQGDASLSPSVLLPALLATPSKSGTPEAANNGLRLDDLGDDTTVLAGTPSSDVSAAAGGPSAGSQYDPHGATKSVSGFAAAEPPTWPVSGVRPFLSPEPAVGQQIRNHLGTTAERGSTGAQGPFVNPIAGRPGSAAKANNPLLPRRRRLGRYDELWGVQYGLPAVIDVDAEPGRDDAGAGIIGLDR